MVIFVDGPAAGLVLELRRAPLFLRLTRRRDGPVFEWDALDQLDDQPAAAETLFVYQRVGQPTRFHARGTNVSGWHLSAHYRMHSTQPADDILRDNGSWQAWAIAEHADEQQPEDKP